MKNKTIKRFYEIGKPHIKAFVIIILFSIIIDVLAASRPILVKTVIDEFMQNKVEKNLANLVETLLFLLTLLVLYIY